MAFPIINLQVSKIIDAQLRDSRFKLSFNKLQEVMLLYIS